MTDTKIVVGIVTTLNLLVLSLFIKFIWSRVQQIPKLITENEKSQIAIQNLEKKLNREIDVLNEKHSVLREHQEEIQEKVEENNLILTDLRLEMKETTMQTGNRIHEMENSINSNINNHFQSIQDVWKHS